MKKGKFRTILFSFFPGAGHFYLGFMQRGLSFMLGFVGWAMIVGGFASFTRLNSLSILFGLLPVIWLYSLFDAVRLLGLIRQNNLNYDDIKEYDHSVLAEWNDILEGKRNKSLAVIFSILPGAGHLYWGYKKEGLQLLATFFLSLFLLDWVRLSIFLFILPVVWVYSFFEVLQFKADEELETRVQLPFTKPKYIGYALIAAGVLILLEKLIGQQFFQAYLSSEIQNMIKTLLVAFAFIAGGIKLIIGNKHQGVQEIVEIQEVEEVEE